MSDASSPPPVRPASGRAPSTRRGALLAIGLAAALGGVLAFERSSPSDDHESASPEVPAALAAALKHEGELRAYETKQVQRLSNGSLMTITRTRLREPGGTSLQRTVHSFEGLPDASGRVLRHSEIFLQNDSGRWHLYPGAAIRQPETTESKERQLLATLEEMRGAAAPRYRVEETVWDGRPMVLVTRIEHPSTVAARLRAMKSIAAARPAAQGANGAPASDAAKFTLASTEYLIDPVLNFVIRKRNVSMTGGIPFEETYAQVNLAPGAAPADFAVPGDAVIHFPKDVVEYQALVARYARVARASNSNNKPKQQ